MPQSCHREGTQPPSPWLHGAQELLSPGTSAEQAARNAPVASITSENGQNATNPRWQHPGLPHVCHTAQVHHVLPAGSLDLVPALSPLRDPRHTGRGRAWLCRATESEPNPDPTQNRGFCAFLPPQSAAEAFSFCLGLVEACGQLPKAPGGHHGARAHVWMEPLLNSHTPQQTHPGSSPHDASEPLSNPFVPQSLKAEAGG